MTAILINALENHKKTIVVCEKRTALEVLENALLNYGLDHHFVLIKDIVKDRKRVVDSVRGRLDNIDFRKQTFNFSKEALDKVIIKANGFIHDINKKHRKLGDKYVANKNWTDLVGELLLELNHVKPYVQLDYDVKNFLFTTEEFDEIIQLQQMVWCRNQNTYIDIVNQHRFVSENVYDFVHTGISQRCWSLFIL